MVVNTSAFVGGEPDTRLRFEPGPADGRDVLLDALKYLMSSGDTGGSVPVEISRPLPLYILNLADLRNDPKPLTRANRVGWRYLVERGDISEFADLYCEDDGGVTFGSLSRGSVARQLEKAAECAYDVALGKDERTLRILEVPALSSSALWLAGNTDVFIPFRAREPLKSVRPEPDFLRDLVRSAHEYAEKFASAPEPTADDSPGFGPG